MLISCLLGKSIFNAIKQEIFWNFLKPKKSLWKSSVEITYKNCYHDKKRAFEMHGFFCKEHFFQLSLGVV